MGLKEENIIYLDCQTTGMSPKSAHLVELAWGASLKAERVSRLVKIPEGAVFPRAAQAVTGLNSEMLAGGLDPASLREEFVSAYENLSRPTFAVIHYAQFERPFLEQLWGEALPFQLICTQKIAKKLLPQVPSRNIRALLGFLGGEAFAIQRAADHVAATAEIWRRLIPLLEGEGITDTEALVAWLKSSGASAPKAKYEYRIDRLKRLDLPRKPGVYRMLTSSGKVLYVGKATSLRDRVNSYFRGQKGRDRKKLEMLSQVWDLSVTVCDSPLEAALLEVDQIKQFDPPYNVSLKAAQRKLAFCSRDLLQENVSQTSEFPLGPFRAGGEMAALRQLWAGELRPVLYEEVAEEALVRGHEIFLATWSALSMRSFLAKGLWRLRELRREVAPEIEVEHSEDTVPEDEKEDEKVDERELPLTAEEVADRLEGVLLGAAGAIVRARELTRLLNSRVRWGAEGAERELQVCGGKIGCEKVAGAHLPWRGLGLEEFDRMRVLKSEIEREGGTIRSN